MNYKMITCSSACNHLKRKLPYSWDLNIYRGCEHGCKYCYAMYSHDYLSSGDYFEEIHVKTNIAEQLERQLSSPSWKQEIINLGGVTDSYQPAEAVYQLMPQIWELLIKYRSPCIISTKSDLILRDFDYIDRLSRITYVNVAETVTCMDESIRCKIEPGGATSQKRLEVLKEFKKTNASTGLHFMPIIPFLTDRRELVEHLYCAASESQVGYVLPGVLYLRGKTRSVFFDFVRMEYPNLYSPMVSLYQTGSAGKAYKDTFYKTLDEIRQHYHLSGNYSKLMKEKLQQPEYRQLSLFD